METSLRLFRMIRAFSSGVPNAKYLAFGTPNTKNIPSWDVLNVSKFWDMYWERTDKNAIILLIILFTFLSPPNTYLSPSATQLFLSLLSGLHLSVASYFFLIFIFFYLSLSSSLSTFRYYRRKSDSSQHLFLFFFFSCHYLSLFLFLSWRRRQFRSETKLADWSLPIWTSARWSKPLLA